MSPNSKIHSGSWSISSGGETCESITLTTWCATAHVRVLLPANTAAMIGLLSNSWEDDCPVCQLLFGEPTWTEITANLSIIVLFWSSFFFIKLVKNTMTKWHSFYTSLGYLVQVQGGNIFYNLHHKWPLPESYHVWHERQQPNAEKILSRTEKTPLTSHEWQIQYMAKATLSN